MSHDVLSVSTPTAARFRAPASNLPAANAAPAENAAYAADAFVAALMAGARRQADQLEALSDERIEGGLQ